MSTFRLKCEAEALRIELAVGLVDVADVVAWADRLIGADAAGGAPVLLDISLSSRKSVVDVMSLLGEMPGQFDPHAVGRRLASNLAERYATGEVDVVGAARAMYRIMLDGLAPDEDFEDDARWADYGVELALDGLEGTLEEVGREIASFLERYRSIGQPPAPPSSGV
jgi:hypothetical protein